MTHPSSPVHALPLECPACGATSEHRVLHVTAYRAGALLSGIARCSACKHSHPFEVRTQTIPIRVVVSQGPNSRRQTMSFPPEHRFVIGEVLEIEEGTARVSRIETQQETTPHSALASRIRTLWATVEGKARVKISLSSGAQTIPLPVEMDPEVVLRVGARLAVAGRPLIIYGLRVGMWTQTKVGYEAPAAKVVRVYARSARTPPPGSID